MMLAEVSEKLAVAERRFSQGMPSEKVNAAAKLSFLRRQKGMIEDRVKGIDAAPWIADVRRQARRTGPNSAATGDAKPPQTAVSTGIAPQCREVPCWAGSER
jgi:hypothetical protein